MAPPRTGGCAFFEDPRFDARTAQPVWLEPRSSPVRLIPDSEDQASRFSLWRIAGPKALFHDGRQLLLLGMAACQVVQIALALSLGEDSSFAYALPAGGVTIEYTRALESIIPLIGPAPRRVRQPRAVRPSRSALVHMRALQAIDATSVGASHREIATTLHGEGDVARRWEADGELRAQVRYLIARGRALIDGGYRELITGRRSADDGEDIPSPDSP
jgi:hypothetical protein